MGRTRVVAVFLSYLLAVYRTLAIIQLVCSLHLYNIRFLVDCF